MSHPNNVAAGREVNRMASLAGKLQRRVRKHSRYEDISGPMLHDLEHINDIMTELIVFLDDEESKREHERLKRTTE